MPQTGSSTSSTRISSGPWKRTDCILGAPLRVVRIASVCVDVFAIVADIDLSKGCILCSKGAFCEVEFNVVVDIDRMGVGCDLILKSALRPVDDDF